MAKQIKRFSPHQTAKVFAILMAVGCIPMLLPMTIFSMFAVPKNAPFGFHFMFIIFPVLYLLFGYVFIAIGCWLYNYMFKYIGGIEIEFDNE